MCHVSSGKYGYKIYHSGCSHTPKFTREAVVKMLTYEQELRRSDHYQQLYTQADCDTDQLSKINLDIQSQVLSSILQVPSTHEDFNTLMKGYHGLRALYDKDPEISQLTDYFKYDMSRECTVTSGQFVDLEKVHIVDMSGMTNSSELTQPTELTLSQFLQTHNVNNLPVAIIGGSYS